LKNIDIFKEQMLLILQNITKDIKNLQETAVTEPIVLPISAANVNYTKPDESTEPLDTQLNTCFPTIPNTLCNYSKWRPDSNYRNNVLFQCYDTRVIVYKKQEIDSISPNTLCLFEIDKNQDQIWIGCTLGKVTINGNSVELCA
jgi:hypothetical protein